MTAPACICTLLAEASVGLSGRQENDIVAALLILVLGIALGIGLVCLLLVLHYMRHGRLAARQGSWVGDPQPTDRRLAYSIFSAPPRWLAVKSGNPYVVQAALGLNKPTRCSWEEGLSVAQDRKLAVIKLDQLQLVIAFRGHHIKDDRANFISDSLGRGITV